MSKAFTREQDGDAPQEELELPETRLPAGTKNYITPGGLRRLQDELQELRYVERPEVTATVAWAAENGDRSENADYKYGKRRLHQIDRRLRFLAKRIRAAEVVDPAERDDHRAFFGATVTVRDEDDELKTYAIVGVDESDASRNRISWVSPLARALRGKEEGDVVTFRSPGGLRELEVERVEYRPLE
jgi:transcription elongation factor GreB